MGIVKGNTLTNRIYTNSSKVYLEKCVTKLYWSYGEDKIELKDISRHYTDLNLHVETENYKAGERTLITIELPNGLKIQENINIDRYGNGMKMAIFSNKSIRLEEES